MCVKQSVLLCSIIWCCFPSGIKAQLLTGAVKDQSYQPLPYVHIGIAGTAAGTVSDIQGNYTLVLQDTGSATDSVTFSCVGFSTRIFAVTDLKKGHTMVVLTREAKLLPVVTKSALKPKRRTMGNRHTRTTMSCNFAIGRYAGQNLGSEIGRRFSSGRDTIRLRTLRFFISQNDFDTVIFRLNIYHLHSGKPAAYIGDSTILVPVYERGKGWITCNLAPYNIYCRGPFAVGIEWVAHSKKGHALSLPITVPLPGAVHYYKYASQGKWQRYLNMSTAMVLEVTY